MIPVELFLNGPRAIFTRLAGPPPGPRLHHANNFSPVVFRAYTNAFLLLEMAPQHIPAAFCVNLRMVFFRGDVK